MGYNSTGKILRVDLTRGLVSVQEFGQDWYRLYPGGKKEYLKKFEASLASAIKAGFILPADRQEILDLAAIAYRGTN